MEEAGRTKTDSKGNFSFKLDAQGPHLVRAIHQGVTYHRMAPPGTTSVDVNQNLTSVSAGARIGSLLAEASAQYVIVACS